MPKGDSISLSVIKRLPRYYRFLGELKDEGVIRISSNELSRRMGLTASQIRQDLNCFGGFGQQGYGYNVTELHSIIGNILGVDMELNTILIGAGNLGKAIASHLDFEKRGCRLIGIFDNNPQLYGKKIADVSIQPVDQIDVFCEEKKPVIAILCIPKVSAQELADKLVNVGIKAFWNFSHYDLKLNYNKNIIVENVHLGDSLMTLTYRVGSNNNYNGKQN